MKPRKPTAEMIRDAKKLKQAKAFIDPQKTFRIGLPDGEIMEFSGTQLLDTAAAFAEMIDAGESGDEARMIAALRKIEQL
jgi:hypothetical protein